MRRSLAVVAALLLAVAFPANPECSGGDFPWKDGERVVFLGDSITQAGVFVEDLEAYLYTRFPDKKYEILNLGLSAETASGLNEPEIGQPRPYVLDRIDRVLERTRPNLVIVCYGMNDGIYHPADADRLRAYQDGMSAVVDRIKRSGADFAILTPPPFDPRPIASRVRPSGAKSYSYFKPFDGYDSVLGQFSDWLVSRKAEGWPVVDVHSAVNRYVASLREADAKASVSPDGVHPDSTGHWLIAQEILRSWKVPSEVDTASVDVSGKNPTTGSIRMNRDGPLVTLSWTTKIPMPRDPGWDGRLAERERFDEHFNRHRLTVAGLMPETRYTLYEGANKLHDFTGLEFSRGIDLVKLADLSTNRRATLLRRLVVERQQMLSLAWVESVGHAPPLFKQALPIDEATRQAGVIEGRIRDLARPVPVSLIIAPSLEN